MLFSKAQLYYTVSFVLFLVGAEKVKVSAGLLLQVRCRDDKIKMYCRSARMSNYSFNLKSPS